MWATAFGLHDLFPFVGQLCHREIGRHPDVCTARGIAKGAYDAPRPAAIPVPRRGLRSLGGTEDSGILLRGLPEDGGKIDMAHLEGRWRGLVPPLRLRYGQAATPRRPRSAEATGNDWRRPPRAGGIPIPGGEDGARSGLITERGGMHMADVTLAPGTGTGQAVPGALDPDLIRRVQGDFRAGPSRRATTNAIRQSGIKGVALDQDVQNALVNTFSHEIETGPITNQERTGRCWMFAGLNTLRVPVKEHCGLKDFELSQPYQMFWDKFERANYFLEAILETLDAPLTGRLVSWLLDSPLNDGGQWDMFTNLVRKHGVVPKYVMPETFHSKESGGMNRLLILKLREDAAALRTAHERDGLGLAELRRRKEAMLSDIYSILVQFLGEPPATFDFEYRDKENAFHREAGLTPQAFFARYVALDLDGYVSVINAPTADKPFGRTYTVKYLGNVCGGRNVLYLNVDIGTLKRLAQEQVMEGEPVWFGCDVGQMSDAKSGVMDTSLYDYAEALGVSFHLNKAQRLDYGESKMTHAMVLTGVHVVDGVPVRWKVENSWGKSSGKDGYLVMSDAWFEEYLYQVVVRADRLPAELRAALEQPPIELEPWDPMGALA